MGPLPDQVEVDFAQRGPEAVGVVHLPAGIGGAAAQPVAGQLGTRDHRLEEATLVDPPHRYDPPGVSHRDLDHLGVEEAHHHRVAGGVGAEDLVGIVVGARRQPGTVGGEGEAPGRGHGVAASRKWRGIPTQPGR